MKRDPSQRSRKALAECVTDSVRASIAKGELTDDDFQPYVDAVTKLSKPILSIEDPTSVDVVATEKWISDLSIGGVPFTGAMDRIDRVGDEFVLVDYKTGKRPNLKFGDDHGDQLRLYAHVVPRALKHEVKELKLYYPAAPKMVDRVRDVPLVQEEVDSVVADFQETWKTHQVDMANAFSPYEPGPLCAWCPFSEFCPAASKKADTQYKGALTRLEAFGEDSQMSVSVPEVSDPLVASEDVLPLAALASAISAASGQDAPSASSAEDDEDQEEAPSAHSVDREGKDNPMPTAKFKDFKPWEEGSGVNAASPYVSTIFGLHGLAVEKLSERNTSTDGLTPFDTDDVEDLTETFLWMITRVARKVTARVPDDLHSIYQRLSGALRDELVIHPLPTDENWEPWAKFVMNGMKRTADFVYEMAQCEPEYRF